MHLSPDTDQLDRLREQLEALRQAVGASAASAAYAEDEVAATLELAARGCPAHASRLQEKAAAARRNAARQRDRALKYSGDQSRP